MTGKELILYILQNDLENEVVIKEKKKEQMRNEEDDAVKFGLGKTKINSWSIYGIKKKKKIGEHLYFLRNTTDPRKDVKND